MALLPLGWMKAGVLLMAAAMALSWLVAPAAAGPPPPGPTSVPGYEVVEARSTISSDGTRTVGVLCPRGKVLLGGGAALSWFYPDVSITGVRPVFGILGYGLVATGEEWLGGHNGDWWIEVTAICADRPPGYQWVEDTQSDNSPSGYAAAYCPESTRTTGVGGYVTGIQGETVFRRLAPFSDLSGAIVHVDKTHNASVSTSWDAGVTAICADLPVKLHSESSTDSKSPSTYRDAKAACGDHERLLGGGLELISWFGDMYGHASLSATMPYANASPPYHAVAAVEDPIAPDDWWAVTSHALCAS